MLHKDLLQPLDVSVTKCPWASLETSTLGPGCIRKGKQNQHSKSLGRLSGRVSNPCVPVCELWLFPPVGKWEPSPTKVAVEVKLLGFSFPCCPGMSYFMFIFAFPVMWVRHKLLFQKSVILFTQDTSSEDGHVRKTFPASHHLASPPSGGLLHATLLPLWLPCSQEPAPPSPLCHGRGQCWEAEVSWIPGRWCSSQVRCLHSSPSPGVLLMPFPPSQVCVCLCHDINRNALLF